MGDREDLADTRAVRRQVFVDEMGGEAFLEDDGADAACIHLVAYENGLPISTGRVMITDDDFVLGRIATLKENRRQGTATGIVEALVEACVTMGGNRQVLHAPAAHRAFFEKIGFTVFGEDFTCFGIPHAAMEHFGGLRSCQGCKKECGPCTGKD